MAHSVSCGLDPHAQIGQGMYLALPEGGFVFASYQLDPLGAATVSGPDGGPLVSQAALDDLAGRGAHNEVVGVNDAGDDRLAEAGAGVDHGLAALSREWVGGKEDAGHCRIDHLLHSDSEAHASGVDPVRSAVADGALGPKRGPAAPYRVEQRLNSHHVEVRILLSGEARVGQVLRRSRGAHGYRNGHFPSQFRIRCRDGPRERVGDGRRIKYGARLGGELGQARRVVGARPGQRR